MKRIDGFLNSIYKNVEGEQQEIQWKKSTRLNKAERLKMKRLK